MPDVHPPPRLPGTLPFAMILASAAGFLDAFLFMRVTPVFVANHSGNLIRLGMDIGTGRWAEAGIAVCSISAFVIGVGAATIMHDRYRQASQHPRPDILLVGEVILIIVVFVMLVVRDLPVSLTPRLDDYPVIFVGALAMGLQTAVLGRVGTVVVSTTYGSGSMAKVGEHTVLGGRSETSHERRGHLRAVRILLAVVVSYAGGAVLAAALDQRTLALLLPIIAVSVATYVEHKRR